MDRYDNCIFTWFLALIDCSKIPAQCRENLECIIYAESLLLSTWCLPPPASTSKNPQFQKFSTLANILQPLRKYFLIQRSDITCKVYGEDASDLGLAKRYNFFLSFF